MFGCGHLEENYLKERDRYVNGRQIERGLLGIELKVES